MYKKTLPLLLCIFLTHGSYASASPVDLYALHIGVNLPPPNSNLVELKYADDDAIRFFNLTKEITSHSALLTVMDKPSQRRHASLADKIKPPQQQHLINAMEDLAQRMAISKNANRRVVFLLSYSGHGIKNQQGVKLALLNGQLGRDFFEKRLPQLPADAIHLFIDACHSEGLLASRGIRGERNAKAQPLRADVADTTFGRTFFSRNPHIGAIFSSTQDAVSHEWSELEAGVFTYELVSGLSGAADINLDGQIGYGEISAFVAAANRSIPNPQALVKMVVEPPRHMGSDEILNIRWFSTTPRLVATRTDLGHFYIERQDGMRLLDAHLEKGRPLQILLPTKARVYLNSAAQGEAVIESRPGRSDQKIPLATIRFKRTKRFAQKGAVEHALRQGFFQLPLSRAFYEGYVESAGILPVHFPQQHQVSRGKVGQDKVRQDRSRQDRVRQDRSRRDRTPKRKVKLTTQERQKKRPANSIQQNIYIVLGGVAGLGAISGVGFGLLTALVVVQNQNAQASDKALGYFLGSVSACSFLGSIVFAVMAIVSFPGE